MRKTMLDELVEEAKASFLKEENARRITAEVLSALPSLDDKEFEALTAAYFEELKRRLARRRNQ